MRTPDIHPEQILVLGGSSFIGGHLMQALPGALGTYCSRSAENLHHFDILQTSLTDLIAKHEIHYAVILLGDTQPDSCINNPQASSDINVKGTIGLLDQLLEKNIKPIFTSSEFIFDGRTGAYRETDPADPILLYGRQKLEIERYIAEHFHDYLIFRLAKVYGDTPGDGTLFSNWLEAAVTGRLPDRCAADQRFSPVYVGDVVAGIIRGIERDLRGVYNLGGAESHSRLELLEMLLTEVRKYQPVDSVPSPCSINDFDLPEKRPIDVSMQTTKFEADFGLKLRGVTESCRRLIAAYFKGERDE